MAPWRVAILLALAPCVAQAEPWLRPIPRPADLSQPAGQSDDIPFLRPQPRPDFAATVAILPPIRPMPRPGVSDVLPQIKPLTAALPQPEVQLAVQPPPQKPDKSTVKGALCQRPDIKGKKLAPIQSRVKGCNVPDAVLVSSVGGVVLNPPATINCEEAQALSTWVANGLQPAFQNQIVALNVADSYACRPRNNVRGNPVSVHGQGQAIDISGFVTKTGRTYTVAQNYNAMIKAAQRAGCGVFHTILGPGSDGYHENHIHFDVAHHGGGDYCH